MSLSTRVKTDLHQRVVLVEVRLVQNVGFEVVVDQWLPSRGQTEDIEAINTGKVLNLTLCHGGSGTAVLLFELIGSEIALVHPVSSMVHTLWLDDYITHARVDTYLATCNVNTSEPDGAGLHRESGYEQRPKSHVDHNERYRDQAGFEG